jgi:hypothetical protein
MFDGVVVYYPGNPMQKLAEVKRSHAKLQPCARKSAESGKSFQMQILLLLNLCSFSSMKKEQATNTIEWVFQ